MERTDRRKGGRKKGARKKGGRDQAWRMGLESIFGKSGTRYAGDGKPATEKFERKVDLLVQ